jgi:2-phosphoglycerate kinase
MRTDTTTLRETIGWEIYNKYGPMRDLIAQYDALSETIHAAEATIIRTINETNEMIAEFIDMVPSRKEAFELNDSNDAIVEALIADLGRLVDKRDAIAQRMYDYEVERRRFLHQPPLPPRETFEVVEGEC